MTFATATVDIAALKARHPLGGVVEASGVKLRGRGRVRQGICPFHEETEGSFTVYADTQRFYCFGCGLGGDVLDFIQRSDGVDLPEAIRRLQGGDWSLPAPVQPAAGRLTSSTPVARDPALLTAAMRFYAAQPQRSPEAQRYLASRGIGLASARRLGLGYSPGQGLRERLQALGFSDERLDVSGLFTGRGERFQGMAVIPELVAARPRIECGAGSVLRHRGRAHWLAGRSIRPDAKPRFQALPGRKPVLGLAAVPSPTPWIVVAEGLFDWLALASWGLPACAALGTQGMDKVASALEGQPRVFLAFDADDAGRDAAGQLRDLLGHHRSAVVTLPEGVGDVAELATRPDGRTAFLNLLRRAAMAAR